MATAPIYCTHKELKRVFPQINEFDGKKVIYGWISMGNMTLGGSATDDFDNYYALNTGLVTQLYFDGVECVSLSKTQVGLLNDANFGTTETTFTIDAGHGLEVGDIIKINQEYMWITVVSTNTITVLRGVYNTTQTVHADDSVVYRILKLSLYDTGDTNTGNVAPLLYYYDGEQDMVILIVDGGAGGGANPSDHLLEAGEDFTTLVTQFRTDASRYLDSRLDPNLPKNQFKNRLGEFDYMIVRTTALICAAFMIRTKDPNSEMAESFMTEVEKNIDDMNNGNAALSFQNTSDSSKGVIRDRRFTSGSLRPVDTKGRWNGTYDLIKVKITTGGVIGTATYSVWVKDSDKLGMNEGNQVVTDEVINGDYQVLSSGLQIRFAGETETTEAQANDVWEIEVMGWQQEVDSSSLKPIRMTRKYR